MSDRTEQLRACGLLRELDDRALGALAAMALPRHYDRGRLIFQQGDQPPGMFVVTAGRVRVYKLAPSGKEHVLHLAGPGDSFAEVAVMGGYPCPASADAIEATDCLLLPLTPLRRALDADHDLCRQLLTSMARWVRHFVGLLEDIVLRDAIGRVAQYLLTASGGRDALELPAMKKHLASHLNLTSETLSRTLRRLDDAGAIASADNGEIRIRDRDGLRHIAEGF